MDRRHSTITVLGLLLLAVGFCLKQTLEFSEALGSSAANILLTAGALLAAIIIGSAVFLLRRQYSSWSMLTQPKRFEAFAQLRRLLAAVWS
jgi:hypothetical protein